MVMEEWRTVVVNGEIYENYMVSNWGNVKSLKFGKEKILKPGKNTNNYLFVNLVLQYTSATMRSCVCAGLVFAFTVTCLVILMPFAPSES